MISLVLTLMMLGILAVGLSVRRRSPPVALGMMAVATAGVWFAWRPEDLTALAKAVGVGRGADLALYLGLSLSFLAIAGLLVQLRHLQMRFTLLARALALLEAERTAGLSDERTGRGDQGPAC